MNDFNKLKEELEKAAKEEIAKEIKKEGLKVEIKNNQLIISGDEKKVEKIKKKYNLK